METTNTALLYGFVVGVVASLAAAELLSYYRQIALAIAWALKIPLPYKKRDEWMTNWQGRVGSDPLKPYGLINLLADLIRMPFLLVCLLFRRDPTDDRMARAASTRTRRSGRVVKRDPAADRRTRARATWSRCREGLAGSLGLILAAIGLVALLLGIVFGNSYIRSISGIALGLIASAVAALTLGVVVGVLVKGMLGTDYPRSIGLAGGVCALVTFNLVVGLSVGTIPAVLLGLAVGFVYGYVLGLLTAAAIEAWSALRRTTGRLVAALNRLFRASNRPEAT